MPSADIAPGNTTAAPGELNEPPVPVQEGQLELETRWDEAKNWVEITVRDDGDGIAEGDRDRIFDPFFTTKPVGQGIGLGLTEAHQVIIEHHRGRIELEPTPAGGAAFTLKIPVNYQAESRA